MASKKKLYLSFIIIFLAFYALGIFFFVILMGARGEGSTEGNFITLGNASTEWTLAILTVPLIVLVTGIIAIYGFSHIFLKGYVKSLGRNAEIGFVPLEELSNSQLWRKIWVRSIILGFFMMNICFTLASQEFIVHFMRSPRLEAEYTIPDPETMWHLVWLLSIPCTLILVPIWLMIDSGVVASKKIKGVDFEETRLASSPLYKIIKGYAGIGFLYNLSIMIFVWVFNLMIADRNLETIWINLLVMTLSPIMGISFMFPLVLLIDNQKERFRKQIEKTLIKLDLNKDIEVSVKLINR